MVVTGRTDSYRPPRDQDHRDQERHRAVPCPVVVAWVCSQAPGQNPGNQPGDKPGHPGDKPAQHGDRADHKPAAVPAAAPVKKAASPVAHPAAANTTTVSTTAQPKGELAYTGAETTAPLALGLIALGAGGALTLAGRRRSSTATV